jgi:HPt (histidine-containing phosphotransfer) domain-containing protein
MSETVDVPSFDPSAIEKLRKVAGDQSAAFIAEMAQLFIDETAKQVAELRRACDASDWKLVHRTAHSMKSSAATLGLMKLSDTCKSLESGTKDGASAARETAVLVDLAASQYQESVGVLRAIS